MGVRGFGRKGGRWLISPRSLAYKTLLYGGTLTIAMLISGRAGILSRRGCWGGLLHPGETESAQSIADLRK